MEEERFLNLFVKYYDKEIADEPMKFYKRTKEVKRLASSSNNCTTRLEDSLCKLLLYVLK